MGTLRAAYAYTPAAYLKNTPLPPRKGQGTIAHSGKKKCKRARARARA